VCAYVVELMYTIAIAPLPTLVKDNVYASR
jgi:hypothetical protein